MDKIERLISIVMILLQKNIVSTTEFAKLFQVSKRTILRDMETLGLANIPLYSIQGVNGGYGIMEEYKLDKRLLSSKDLENILTALSGLEQILLHKDIELTIRKMESMVGSLSQKGFTQVSFYEWDGRTEFLQILNTCQTAIMQNRLVSFKYMDRNGTETNRMVEPYQLHYSERSWYLKGFCLDRMGNRTFKLSRTDDFKLEMKTFVPREYEVNQRREKSDQTQLVAIKALIPPRIKDHFIERYGRKSIEPYNAELLLVTMHVPQNDNGYQFVAGFGADLKIIEPQSYVDEFRGFLNKMMEAYT